MSSSAETRRAEVIARLVGPMAGRSPARASAEAYAPANIALCKYWGKRDAALNLPCTSSLSMSLGRLGSRVVLRPRTGLDQVTLNGAPLAADSAFVRRVRVFLDLFRPAPDWGVALDAHNTIPTAAGFASSASGFAALTRALDSLFGWNLPPRDLSIIARLGSGSACRSLDDGFVEWQAGTRADGMDSYAEPFDTPWPDLCMALVVLSADAKAIGSREAMQRTVDSSALYDGWPRQVAADLAELKTAIRARDLATVGAVSERNALAMHATMLGARPPILYWRPETVSVMHRIWELRAAGLSVYFTMDAGPNVKVLYDAREAARVRSALAEWTVLTPEDSEAQETKGNSDGH